MARKQRTYISKYSFANRTIKLWNQLPAEAIAAFPCKSYTFREKITRVIVRRSAGFLKGGDKTSKCAAK